jgi:outer membrane protein OmpA-like peptidoglycan-associated protein
MALLRACAIALVVSAAFSSSALAQSGQGFTLERYEPSPAGQWSFWVDHPRFREDLDFTAGLTFDYGHNPLVLGVEQGNDFIEEQSIVEHQLYGHVDLAIGLLDRLELSLSLPIALYQKGDDALGIAASDAAVGDPRLGALLRIVGDPLKDAISLSGGVRVWVPIDGNGSYVGDDYARFAPRAVLAGGPGNFLWSANAEFLYRHEASIGTLPKDDGNSVGSELHLGAALAYSDVDHVQYAVGPEVAVSTTVIGGKVFDKDYTSLEVLLGGHYKIARTWLLGLAGGLGALQEPGTPDARIIVRFAYSHDPEPALQMPPPLELDRDHDGVLDANDMCPDEDQGPNPDENRVGCPRRDRDRDGVFDDEDACPDTAGDRNEDKAKNGCPPPPDRDQDGVIDDEDQCADTPRGEHPDEARQGCPLLDTDGDGVFDKDDQCVDVPQGDKPHPTKVGCPTIKDAAIVVDPIFFKTDKAELLPESIPVLQSVVEVLEQNPDITKVRIEGHTDNQGKPGHNLTLSKRRAKAVLKWLVKAGITKSRLESNGYGQTVPIADNETEEGRSKNRRVMFVIVKGNTN